ncbi:MAG: exodeoxyribonuclease V subunit alpha [Methylococcales bacterium]|nr:exodeoxyribonuclease V subunit alpha [Methylococcales bacterium]
MLDRLLQEGGISPLTFGFATFLVDEFRLEKDSITLFTAALVSERNQSGDTCIDLAILANQPLFDVALDFPGRCPLAPDIDDWLSMLGAEAWIGVPGDTAPLILEPPRLYLGKFWHLEKKVQDGISRCLSVSPLIDHRKLREGLARLFPTEQSTSQPDGQKVATALAVMRNLAILSGGPGTGKTTAVVKVLALLLEQDSQMRIRLAAPTGKAAAQMVDSIEARKRSLVVETRILEKIPEQASTLHRLLEYDGHSFGANSKNPLLLDCLVIDEASMIDLPLMARLLEALPADARLILIGDRDQLASVEAGNVLGDLTGGGQIIRYSPVTADRLAVLTSVPVQFFPVSAEAVEMADSIALLEESYRFGTNSGIGRLSRMVNRGQPDEVLSLLEYSSSIEVEWSEMTEGSVSTDLINQAVSSYAHYALSATPEAALKSFDGFRVLCATQKGAAGVGEINRLIGKGLRRKTPFPDSSTCHGQPVMITVNDYETGLFNGDIGLLWADDSGFLRAWFRFPDETRSFPLRDLPKHVPAWAMTVHKSQGSEFDRVVLILPPEDNHPLLCRELIYTGITRCREQIIIHASRRALFSGIRRKLDRSSGLAEKLGWRKYPSWKDSGPEKT